MADMRSVFKARQRLPILLEAAEMHLDKRRLARLGAGIVPPRDQLCLCPLYPAALCQRKSGEDLAAEPPAVEGMEQIGELHGSPHAIVTRVHGVVGGEASQQRRGGNEERPQPCRDFLERF